MGAMAFRKTRCPQMIRNPWLVPPALVLPALVPVLADFARLHDRSIAASTVETALPRAACARRAPHPLRHMVRFGLSRPGRTCSPSRSLAPLVGPHGDAGRPEDFAHVPWFPLVGQPTEGSRAVMMIGAWALNLAVAEWIIRRPILTAPLPA